MAMINLAKEMYNTWRNSSPTLDMYLGFVYDNAPTIVFDMNTPLGWGYDSDFKRMHSRDLQAYSIVLPESKDICTFDISTGKQRKLLGWNIKRDGSETHYDFGYEITDENLFTD